MNYKPLKLGKLTAKVPIIQGGMGVGVSLSNLSSAVANAGGIGVISTAMIGYREDNFMQDPLKANLTALAKHIRLAREKSPHGIIGVNIMVASNHYAEYVKCAVENKIDLIISGAGLPIDLPKFIANTGTLFAPIVSSLKAIKLLFKTWEKRFQKVSDFVIIEGPAAGGHLGFKNEDLIKYETENFDEEILKILAFVKQYPNIPVIYAGGVSSPEIMKHYMDLGCDGVQIGTRFVATEECDAHINFKKAYIDCVKEDIQIVKSPVGLPGRALKNSFIRRSEMEKIPIRKCYQCLAKCDQSKIPYCISNALIEAVKGNTDEGLIFCGKDAYKIDKIVKAEEIINEFMS